VPSPPEPERPPALLAIVLRALLYAGVITLIVLSAPEESPRFIYMAF
jgi:hypothetical protein